MIINAEWDPQKNLVSGNSCVFLLFMPTFKWADRPLNASMKITNDSRSGLELPRYAGTERQKSYHAWFSLYKFILAHIFGHL